MPHALARALREFEAQHRTGVHVEILDRTQERRQLSDFAIFSAGPDVSEVGTTWLSGLIAMNALRPFSPWELDALQREGAFFLPVWQPGVDREGAQAIPWRTDTRVIYYRRDLLQQAGIDPEAAFLTTSALQDTLRRLGTTPDALPCVIPTTPHPMILHILAPWVWQAGGRFMCQDRRKTQFTEPQALDGIVRYFETFAPALAPAAQGLSDNQASDLFLTGQTAMIVSGHWILHSIKHQAGAAPEVEANLGLAVTPGAQYQGGMSLVIWKHCRHPQEALKLVRFLTGQRLQTTDLLEAGYLPARQQALSSPPFTTDPHFRLIGQSLQSGQGFDAAYMWGLVEDRLAAAIAEIWQQVFAEPDIDVAHIVAEKLESLAARLDRILSSG